MSNPAFETWWAREGYLVKVRCPEDVKRLCEIAWSNGRYMTHDYREIVEAVNESCTCGGNRKGKGCPACETYNYLFPDGPNLEPTTGKAG